MFKVVGLDVAAGKKRFEVRGLMFEDARDGWFLLPLSVTLRPRDLAVNIHVVPAQH
jgi:hypothetical protein